MTCPESASTSSCGRSSCLFKCGWRSRSPFTSLESVAADSVRRMCASTTLAALEPRRVSTCATDAYPSSAKSITGDALEDRSTPAASLLLSVCTSHTNSVRAAFAIRFESAYSVARGALSLAKYVEVAECFVAIT